MRRREFITLLGGAAAWPLAARAQQPAKLPTIGYLGTAAASAWAPWTAAFVQRLHALGWIDGRTVVIQYRWAEGRTERSGRAGRRIGPAQGGRHRHWWKRGARGKAGLIGGADRVRGGGRPGWHGPGLVASLARPGGNVTGLSIQQSDLAGKRIELLREIVPGLRRLAIMANVGFPTGVQEMGEARSAARMLGLDPVALEIRRAEDIAPAFESLKDRADALYVVGDALVITHRVRINTLALIARLPTMHNNREFVEAAGLMSYGPNLSDLFRRAADYVDKILRGAKPADLPVEQPTKFELVINLKTAKTLGLEVPANLLALADEVIE